jgi:glycosyltransferase involved in cell wall biosynthesis
MIGIGITSHNRGKVARHTLEQIIKFSPLSCKIVVVDDASIIPFEGATYRFEQNVGISRAKNKCLELLEGCDHLFIFDDDFYPIVDEWWVPYIESKLNHACFTFDRLLINSNEFWNEYEKPNGCMMYFTKCCIETVGGWDTDFQGYGYEHLNFSDRIFNIGLTPARYIDVPNSSTLFYSHDQARTVETSIPYFKRDIARNTLLYNEKFFDKNFKPYK